MAVECALVFVIRLNLLASHGCAAPTIGRGESVEVARFVRPTVGATPGRVSATRITR